MNHNDLVIGASKIDVADSAVASPAIPVTNPAPSERTATASASVSTQDRQILTDRRVRLRLLAGSVLGLALLNLALRLPPAGGSPFAAPPDPAAWAGAVSGIVGIWLVPGLWLSALMTHSKTSFATWLATRIGATLAWYALVGPLVHQLGEGAQATTGVIFGTTAAATAAACFGIALGLLRRPVDPRLRILVVAVAAAACTQAAISLITRLWTYDMNYEHIHRLDWLIVLTCASLAVAGQCSRPTLPVIGVGHVRKTAGALAVLVAAVAVVVAVGSRWSPEQRMPSTISVEQVPAPAGADLALALTAVGPDGSQLLQRAVFAASDDVGRPIQAGTRLAEKGRTADQATLLMVLDPSSRPALCGQTGPPALSVKLTVRDTVSGLLVQALIPAGWCAR